MLSDFQKIHQVVRVAAQNQGKITVKLVNLKCYGIIVFIKILFQIRWVHDIQVQKYIILLGTLFVISYHLFKYIVCISAF